MKKLLIALTVIGIFGATSVEASTSTCQGLMNEMDKELLMRNVMEADRSRVFSALEKATGEDKEKIQRTYDFVIEKTMMHRRGASEWATIYIAKCK